MTFYRSPEEIPREVALIRAEYVFATGRKWHLDEMLCIKELCCVFKRPRTYFYWMRKHGFVMAGGMATPRQVQAWLVRNNSPRSTGQNGTSPR